MSQTRFSNDKARLKKEMEISTFEGRYQLDCPGPAGSLSFLEDPGIRIQKFGANNRTNTIGIENDLMGITKPLSRDNVNDTYKSKAAKSEPMSFKSQNPFVLESRASNPAWTLRGVDQHYERWESPWLNPLDNIEKDFKDNIQTRLMEKSISETENQDWNMWLPISNQSSK